MNRTEEITGATSFRPETTEAHTGAND
jgi:hypothetical protein